MSHHVYTTRGIVLALYPQKEADKTAAILTRDLGLVHASARGVRKPDSKLATSLVEYGLVKVSLVKGKRFWRVTTVSLISNLTALLRKNREAVTALSRVVALLGSLIRGEDKNVELYDELESSVLSLLDNKEDVETWEIYTVARLLSHLGYLSKDEAPAEFGDVKARKREFVALVNAGIRESGLE